MRLDEVQRQVGQRPAVVVALAWPRIRHLVAEHRQPVGVDGSLLLEIALKGVGDVLQAEGAHRAARDAVRGRGESAVHQLGGHFAVLAVYQVRGGFWKKECWGEI